MELDKAKNIIGGIFFAICIIAFFYMFICPLTNVIVHVDEYFTTCVVTLPVKDIITVTANDVHPPLHYLLCKLVLKLAHSNELYLLKVVSIIPYGLIILLSATKIRKDYDLFTAGLFSFSLLVMSDFFRYYFVVRMYSWATLFLIICLICVKDIIHKPNSKSWIILTIFATLCAYTHYFVTISVGCMYLILLVYILAYKKEEFKNWLQSTVVAFLLYSAWIPSLVLQLTNVHDHYWIPAMDLNTTILSLGYFGIPADFMFSIVSIVILLIVIAIYLKDYNKEEKYNNLLGVGVFITTITIAILICYLYKPVLVVRYILPVSAMIWFALAVIVGKIENKKLFIFSFALICLLLVSGIYTVFITTEQVYNEGALQKEILDNMSQDNNSMVIVTNRDPIMYFLEYSEKNNMYFLNTDWVFGEDMERLHKLYDFNVYNKTDIDNLIQNNSDKNVYVISWKDPKINSTLTELYRGTNFIFSKVDFSNSNSTKLKQNMTGI